MHRYAPARAARVAPLIVMLLGLVSGLVAGGALVGRMADGRPLQGGFFAAAWLGMGAAVVAVFWAAIRMQGPARDVDRR